MPSTVYKRIVNDVRPLPGQILAVKMERGVTKSKGGIILQDDNGTDRGIRPRWCQVYKVGAELQKTIPGLVPGKWILVEHGRWTWGIDMEAPEDEGESLYLQRIDPVGIMLISDECPL